MKSDDAKVNISVTFRNTDSTEALKTYAQEKVLHAIRKYVHYETEAHVVLSVQKRDHIAEISAHSKDADVTAKAVTEDLYSAIDKMVDNFSSQLRKKKEQRTAHKQRPVSEAISG